MNLAHFTIYQDEAMRTATYPDVGTNYNYPAYGLAEETGEVMGKIAKVIRDQRGVFVQKNIDELEKEMGDVLWNLAALAFEFGLDLGDVAHKNLAKLQDRQERKVLKGSGDNR